MATFGKHKRKGERGRLARCVSALAGKLLKMFREARENSGRGARAPQN